MHGVSVRVARYLFAYIAIGHGKFEACAGLKLSYVGPIKLLPGRVIHQIYGLEFAAPLRDLVLR